MANPSTIDSQKVVASAIEKLQPFSGNVDKVSSTPHMEAIYENMAKMFDAFTNGVMLEQGARTDVMFHQVYRSLDRDFLDIIQDSDAVDRIVENIKKKQESLTPDNVDKALVSETTKKIVLNSLNPEECSQMDVVLDFIDEIQTSILQVRLNLSREYERQRLELAKSEKGQIEDLQRLDAEFKQQNAGMMDAISGLSQDEMAWKDEHLKKLDRLRRTFMAGTSSMGGGNVQPMPSSSGVVLPGMDANTIQQLEKSLASGIQASMKQHQTKFNPNKTIGWIRGDAKGLVPSSSISSVKPVPWKLNIMGQALKLNGFSLDGKNHEEPLDGKMMGSPLSARTFSEGMEGGLDAGGRSTLVDQTNLPSGKLHGEIKKSTGKDAGGVMDWIVCPYCGNRFKQGQKPTFFPPTKPPSGSAMLSGMKKPISLRPSTLGISTRTKKMAAAGITASGVLATIGTIQSNISTTLKDGKFRRGLTMDYPAVQKGIGQEMMRIDKHEMQTSKDLNLTQKGISKLKAKKKGGGILGLLLGGLTSFAFAAIGALILITLFRAAWRKWKQTYMPPSDGEKYTILGVTIPGVSEMKSFAIGIWNFITVGLPNWFNRLKVFFGGIHRKLFGKKGAFKDRETTMNTLRKIGLAIVIGMSKKAQGVIATILGYALALVPTIGPVLQFLCKFLPAMWTFVGTQLMLLWSNRKAAAETKLKQDAQAQGSAGQSIVGRIHGQVAALAKGVKPFKGQMEAIPGLVTPKAEGSGGPKRSAIMRRVPTKFNKNLDAAKNVQRGAYEKEMEKMEKADGQRMKSATKAQNFTLFHIKNAEDEVNKEVEEYTKKLKSVPWYKRFGMADPYVIRQNAIRRKRDVLLVAFKNQIWALDAYVKQLANSKRYANVKGGLYDPMVGWNPGYRITSQDLLSAIPLEPFEEIHKKADVPIGQPLSEPFVDEKGFRPFTWMQGGAPIAVHPINYEIERAKAIRKIYVWLTSPAQMWNLETARKKAFAWWREWNYALGPRDGFGYENEKSVLYRDKFAEFLNEYRQGRIDHDSNTFAKAMTLDKTLGEKIMTGVAVGLGAVVAAPAAVVLAPFVVSGVAVKLGMNYARKKKAEMDRMFAYDRKVAKDEDDSKQSWFSRMKNKVVRGANKVSRKIEVSKRFQMWRDYEASGIKYGDVRSFMMDSGILDLFNKGGQIINPVGHAIPFIEKLIDMSFLNPGKNAKDSTRMHDLMYQFFEYAGIKGYEWDKVKDDRQVLAAFAQSFLEHIGLRVIPQWNRVERYLSDDITHMNNATRKQMYLGIQKLHRYLSQAGIMKFLKAHLRFPNMKVTLVDYSNAKKKEKASLTGYRKKLGIVPPHERDRILKKWGGLWSRIDGMPLKDIADGMSDLKKQIQLVEYEARYTGDRVFSNELQKILTRLESEYDRKVLQQRQSSGKDDGKIVKNPASVAQNVIEPPPKTMAEIEEEKRKKDAEEAARKAEEERKRKEEEEKRLKEEAKRKEALAIANAKIKAMEAIRKQEENYERILQKMIDTPDKVTDAELKSVGDEVNNLKQEAENRIAALPREEREMKLALIRGDKISDKTFKEIKDTAIGLHGNLQGYMDEVNKIPVGSLMAIQNMPVGPQPEMLQMQDPDAVDLGDN